MAGPYYFCVDPDNGDNTAAVAAISGGKHTTQVAAEAAPWSTWAGALGSVAAADTNYILGARGKVAQEEISILVTGASDKIQTFSSYGPSWLPKHEIRGDGTAEGIQGTGKSYIHVLSLAFRDCGGTAAIRGLGNATRGPDGWLVEDCDIFGTTGATTYGIKLSDAGVTPAAWAATVRNNYIEDTNGGGIDIAGRADGVLVEGNVVMRPNRNFTENNHWGIHSQPSNTNFPWTDGNITLVDPAGIYAVTLGAGQTAVDVAFGQSTQGFYIIKTVGTYAALNPGEFAQSGTTVRVHLGEDISGLSGATIRVANNVCQNITFRRNYVYGVFSPDGIGGSDGVGIGHDTHVLEGLMEDNVVERCEGSGYSFNNAQGGTARRNHALHCGKWGMAANLGHPDNTYTLKDNTFIGNLVAAMRINDVGSAADLGCDAEIIANLCIGSPTGLLAEGSSEAWTEDGNVIDEDTVTAGFTDAVTVAEDPTRPFYSRSHRAHLRVPVSAVGGGSASSETEDARGVTRAPWRTPGAIALIPQLAAQGI